MKFIRFIFQNQPQSRLNDIYYNAVGRVLIALFNDCVFDKSDQITNPTIAKINPIL